jgi:hypothetical protein
VTACQTQRVSRPEKTRFDQTVTRGYYYCRHHAADSDKMVGPSGLRQNQRRPKHIHKRLAAYALDLIPERECYRMPKDTREAHGQPIPFQSCLLRCCCRWQHQRSTNHTYRENHRGEQRMQSRNVLRIDEKAIVARGKYIGDIAS